jgi:hypothetical protein
LKHLSELIRDHEKPAQHMSVAGHGDTRSFQSIEKDIQKQIIAEKLHWWSVLERLFTIVEFLASRNIAFRGSSDTLQT